MLDPAAEDVAAFRVHARVGSRSLPKHRVMAHWQGFGPFQTIGATGWQPGNRHLPGVLYPSPAMNHDLARSPLDAWAATISRQNG